MERNEFAERLTNLLIYEAGKGGSSLLRITNKGDGLIVVSLIDGTKCNVNVTAY